MASETWRLKEEVSGLMPYPEFTFNFTSNGESFTGFYDEGSGDVFEYILADGNKVVICSNMSGIEPVYYWKTSPYRLITLETPASGSLLTWLQQYAVRRTDGELVTVDLTSLSGYESLAAGTYAIGVKAKSQGYQDSDLSSTVSFTKLAAPVATAADTTVTWDAVTNADSYDVYVDGELYENTAGVTPKGYNVTIASKTIYTGSGYTTGYLAINREVSTTDYDYKLTGVDGKFVDKTGTDVTFPLVLESVESLSAVNTGDSLSWFELQQGGSLPDLFNIEPSAGVKTITITQDYDNLIIAGSNND